MNKDEWVQYFYQACHDGRLNDIAYSVTRIAELTNDSLASTMNRLSHRFLNDLKVQKMLQLLVGIYHV